MKRFNFIKIYIISIFIFFFSFSAYSNLISQSEFLEVKEITHKILEQFPKENNVYIGVGRSPTPITTFGNLLYPKSFINLPLSRFHVDDDDSLPLSTPMKPENKKELFRHFDNFLPSKADLQGKTVILIDYAVSGFSLECAQKYLSEYFNQGDNKVIVKAVALTNPDRIMSHLNNKFILIDLKAYPYLKEALYNQKYDAFSQYGQFHFTRDKTENVKQNKSHDELIERIKTLNDSYSPAKIISCSHRVWGFLSDHIELFVKNVIDPIKRGVPK